MALTLPAPAIVRFRDTSTPAEDITYRHWDFGNGNTADDTTEPSDQTYSTVGVYSVSLAISSPRGMDTAEDTVTVYSNYDPFTAAAGLSSIPAEVFAADFVADPGDYLTFEVSLDGVTYAASITFTTGGEFTVYVRGEDPAGGLLVATADITITEP